jgi:hypothetical protein
MTRPVAAARRREEVGAGLWLDELNLLRWTNDDVLRPRDTNDGDAWNDDINGVVDKTIRRAAEENFIVNN